VVVGTPNVLANLAAVSMPSTAKSDRILWSSSPIETRRSEALKEREGMLYEDFDWPRIVDEYSSS
jgi:hypothetical protein